MPVSALFDPEPQTWGLRGDPYLGRDVVGDLPGQPASLLGVSHAEDGETTVDAIRVHLANLSHHETAAPKD
jgi:hypothetical protein